MSWLKLICTGSFQARYVLALLQGLIAISAFGEPQHAHAQPTENAVVQGELVQRDLDYAKDGPLELRGEWQVIWGKLVPPDKFDSEYQGDHFSIPDRWGDVDHQAMDGAYGVATFRAKLDIAPSENNLSIHLISPHSAWRLYADGVSLGGNGTVSDQRDRHRSHYTSRIFPVNSGESELVLQVSNFSHAHGGPGHAPTIWDSRDLLKTLGQLSLYYVLVLGIMFTIGLFHLIIYLADRSHREHGSVHLWFALLCLIMVFRISGVIPYFHLYFADSSYWSDLRLPYASLFAAPAIYLLFFSAAFPRNFPVRATQSIILLNIALLVLVLLTPEWIYTQLRDVSIAMNVFVVVYSLVFTAGAIRSREPGATIVLISNAIFLATALNDAAIYMDYITGFDLTPFGVLALGIGYSYALLLRLQSTFEEARDTSTALAELNRDLEQQVGDRTRAFEAAAAKAQNNAKESAQFVAAASHDLRQPLHALAMFNSALKARISSEVAAKLVEKQASSIDNLAGLLQDTLDTARAEVGQKNPQWTPVDMSALFASVTVNFDIRMAKHDIAFSHSVDQGDIVTDAGMLQRILSNLIDNAAKAARSAVKVSARAQGATWLVEIYDDGHGIGQQDIERVFESYVSLADPEPAEQGGYGLGLYIVKNFTDMLGGTVNVTSSPDAGTTFTLELPMKPVGYQRNDIEMRSAHDVRPNPGLKVLAIDDEDDVLDAMAEMLSAWGCVTQLASTGSQALALLDSGFRPDLAIVDYHLFHEDGPAVVARLQARLGKAFPAIMITGATEPEILTRIEAQRLPLLSKPVDPARLGKFLRQLQSIEVSD